MFAYCGNDPVNYSDPSGNKRKFWYALFEDHQPGYIHRQVQQHILTVYNIVEALYQKEYYLPGIGRADIVKPSTGEVWEIKHGGSSLDSEINGIDNALTQLEKYIGESTGLHPGSAGEFNGFFTINYDDSSYAVIYLTPDAGVVLYYLLPIQKVEKTDYVYVPSTVPATSSPSCPAALGLALMAMGCAGGSSAGYDPVLSIAYGN